MVPILLFFLSYGFLGKYFPLSDNKGDKYIDVHDANLRYPKGIADNVSIANHLKNYYDNSLVEGSSQWNKLLLAAKENHIYVVPAFSHRQGDYIYMAQALISPAGETILLRHKLRPSGGEREIWSDGTIEELKVVATPYGRWGLLECWEHFHPAMTYNVQSQVENLHIASFPC